MAFRTFRAAVLSLIFPAILAVSPPASAAPPPREDGNVRLFQQFITDAAVTSQWWEARVRVLQGASPPVQNADAIAIGPVIAVSPISNLELGGRVDFIDYQLDHAITTNRGPRRFRFDGESGAGDIEVFGKYRVMTNPVQLAFGGTVTLPTGSEDDGLGTGEVVPAVFAAVRANMNGFIGVAHLGARFNHDAQILGTNLNGRTSVFLGAGFLVEPSDSLYWTGELTIETEKYRDAPGVNIDSDLRLTGGISWTFSRHSSLRGSAGVGLADAAPDLELSAGYVWSF